jgi:hypothetical protein
MRRILIPIVLLALSATPAAAQNPVSIFRLGTATDITTTIPVSGTVAATQSGSWLVQGMVAHDAAYSGNPLPTGCYASASAPSDVSGDGDIARMWCLRNGALSVNITNASIAITAASLPLPTGASTAAKQPALGTAGTASADVITVQGIASMTPLQVGDNSSSLTVDAPVGTPVFVRLSDGASPIATLPVSDAGGSVTVDGSIGITSVTPSYGSKTAITWTGTSLANGSSRESTVVNMTSTKCADVRLRFQSKGQTSGTSYIRWYVYTGLGDTLYTDNATGSDAAFTTANIFNSRFLGSQKMNAGTSATNVEFQLSDIFTTVPDKWGVIGDNESGAALSATAGDHVLEYECVN